MLSRTDLVIECRDYRIPISSRNPLLETTLRERERLIMFTKHDLGKDRDARDMQVCLSVPHH